MKKVIIDPRTGDRETIYEKDKPKKQQKLFLRQRPAEILIDSDDSDEQQQAQYVRVVKHRTIPTEVLPRYEPSPKYVMIKKRSDSNPVYALTSKMPAIKTSRRIVYEVPPKKPLTTYIYPTNGKYYK
jgi:lipoprotein-anchoring transpeptidase ErfK/SrfK